jgi:hypothetical protein
MGIEARHELLKLPLEVLNWVEIVWVRWRCDACDMVLGEERGHYPT